MLTDNDIERIVRRIVHHQRPLAVGLFGSYAMGSAHESSDPDMFVVRNCIERGQARTLAVRRLLVGILHPLDVHVFTPAEFEQQVTESQSFAWYIVRHNAHYNRAQFYEKWFSSLADQVRFLKHTLRFPCYGDPEYTFSDVERAIQRELVNRNYLSRYELRLAEEQQAIDLALLRHLESKYRTRVAERDQEPPLIAPPVDQTPVTPVQGSLF